MNINIYRKELVDVLNNAVKAINIKSPLEVIKAVKIVADENNNVTIDATDMTMSMSQTIEGTVKEPGTIILPYKAIELIRKLESEFVEINGDTANLSATIKAGKGKTFFSCYDPKDFPDSSKQQEILSKLSMSGAELRELSKVNFAVGKDMSRQIFTGILFDISDKLMLAATDTFRLAMLRTDIKAEQGGRFVVPSAITKLIPALFSEEKIDVSFSQNKVALEAEKIRVSISLLPGEFPAVERLIPESSALTALVKTGEIKGVLDRAMLFAQDNNNNNMLRFELINQNIIISAGEGSARYAEAVGVKIIEGESVGVVSFNCKLTQDAVSSIDSEFAEIRLTSQHSPVIFTPHGDDAEKQISLLVPLRTASVEKEEKTESVA